MLKKSQNTTKKNLNFVETFQSREQVQFSRLVYGRKKFYHNMSVLIGIFQYLSYRHPIPACLFTLCSPGQLQRLMKPVSGIRFNTISDGL